jgi:hypothetical protein
MARVSIGGAADSFGSADGQRSHRQFRFNENAKNSR